VDLRGRRPVGRRMSRFRRRTRSVHRQIYPFTVGSDSSDRAGPTRQLAADVDAEPSIRGRCRVRVRRMLARAVAGTAAQLSVWPTAGRLRRSNARNSMQHPRLGGVLNGSDADWLGGELQVAWDGAVAEPGRVALGAFDETYRSLWWPMIRLAAVLVDDLGAAEDVVQDAFTALYRRWDTIVDLGAVSAYLRVSVVNGSRSALRRRGTARKHLMTVREDTCTGPFHAPRARWPGRALRRLLRPMSVRAVAPGMQPRTRRTWGTSRLASLFVRPLSSLAGHRRSRAVPLARGG
jgi:hypothetical protein